MEQLSQLSPESVTALLGPPGVGKSTRFPLTLVQNFSRPVLVVVPTTIGAKVLQKYVGENRGVSYLPLNLVYNQVLTTKKIDYSIICIDDIQLAKLEQSLLFLMLREMKIDKIFLLGLAVPTFYFSYLDFTLKFPGKRYPVTIGYLPAQPLDDEDKLQSCLRELSQLLPIRKGSVLIICRQNQVKQYAFAISGISKEKVVSVSLDSYDPQLFEAKRQIIVSSNILESTITIPDLELIIDTMETDVPITAGNGSIVLVKQSLESKIQAQQRTGRVGRTAPGTCLRLCSEEFFDKLADNYPEEISQLNLAVPELRLRYYGWGELIPAKYRALADFQLDLVNTKILINLPLSLIPGVIAASWLANQPDADQVATMILYCSLIEVGGPYIPGILKPVSDQKMKSWQAPSDFHCLLLMIESEPNWPDYTEAWSQVLEVMSYLRAAVEDLGFVVGTYDLYAYLKYFTELVRKVLPKIIYTYRDDLAEWVNIADESVKLLPNQIYPQKNWNKVVSALNVQDGMLMLGLGL